ncbi:MAG: metallophosphoesterase [Bacteroidota bacterium]
MKRTILTLASALCLIMSSKAQTIMHNEILGRPTDNSIVVSMFFSDSAEVSVQYGTISGIYPNQTSWQVFADSVPAVMMITGLQADTKYYYRVCYRHPGDINYSTRPEYKFHTARIPGSSYSFIVQADPHLDVNSDSALYRVSLKDELSDSADFMIDLGDFLMTDKLIDTTTHTVPFDTIPYRCHMYRNFYGTACNSLPLFNVIGNHEGESGWYNDNTANNVAVWDAQQRTKFFTNPHPDGFYTGDTSNTNFVGHRESYYSWQWGDALFIVLDPYWYSNPKPDSLHGWYWTLGKPQYDWLKATLENSTATFKFVFSHQLVGGDPQGRGGIERANFYEWGGNNIDSTYGWTTNRPGWYKPIKDLLTENRVNVFFHGHDHFFGEQQKDCMIYQETPQPSLHNFNYPNQAAAYGYNAGLIIGNCGYLKVDVAPTGVTVNYIRAYKPSDTSSTRHNKDVAASYFIGNVNCYDSLSGGIPVVWNGNYADEIVYPNPFLKETTIAFNLKQTDRISIMVMNEKGQPVRRLMNSRTVSEGKFQIVWDGADASGVEQPNGIYWYSIIGEKSGAKSGKMVLMR